MPWASDQRKCEGFYADDCTGVAAHYVFGEYLCDRCYASWLRDSLEDDELTRELDLEQRAEARRRKAAE